jgi:hypothetical protein
MDAMAKTSQGKFNTSGMVSQARDSLVQQIETMLDNLSGEQHSNTCMAEEIMRTLEKSAKKIISENFGKGK